MTTITVNTPVPVNAPRGAALAGTWFAKLLGAMGDMVESRVQSRQLAKRVAEANAVRRYAQDVMGQDRRFAADLLSAADRHELG